MYMRMHMYMHIYDRDELVQAPWPRRSNELAKKLSGMLNPQIQPVLQVAKFLSTGTYSKGDTTSFQCAAAAAALVATAAGAAVVVVVGA
jgi:hypothetical protein